MLKEGNFSEKPVLITFLTLVNVARGEALLVLKWDNATEFVCSFESLLLIWLFSK